MVYKDIFGKALLDYYNENYAEDLITWTSISEKEYLPVSYLFRTFEDMPSLEQKALQLARGKILDVGCGAGNHSLWLQQQDKAVKAIDISHHAIEVCKKRGVNNAVTQDLREETDYFDTILLLMNGSGIFQELSRVPEYLDHLKSLLLPDGQILIDSSDIKYMFMDDSEQNIIHTPDERMGYYGELDYFMSYKNEMEVPMKWLYVDFDTLKTICDAVQLKCELIMKGDHFDYLACITR